MKIEQIKIISNEVIELIKQSEIKQINASSFQNNINKPTINSTILGESVYKNISERYPNISKDLCISVTQFCYDNREDRYAIQDKIFYLNKIIDKIIEWGEIPSKNDYTPINGKRHDIEN